MLLYSESCSGVFSSTVLGGGRGWAQLVELPASSQPCTAMAL